MNNGNVKKHGKGRGHYGFLKSNIFGRQFSYIFDVKPGSALVEGVVAPVLSR